ncbi:MAG: glycosyltransferase family 39 protein [Chloroflexi bacterium]|nr:glycosyltransferase family 39 protein [Chloroflexota bacterium]
MAEAPPNARPPASVGRARAQRRRGWSDPLRLVLLLLAAGAALESATLFRADKLTPAPFLWLVLAVGVSALALQAPATRPDWVRLDASSGWPLRSDFLLAALGLGLLADLAYILRLVPEPVLVAGWLLAQALLVAACLPRPRRPRLPSRGVLLELAAVLAVLLVAAWLRLWDNAIIPQRIHGDSTMYGLEGRAILAGRYRDFFGNLEYNIPLIGYVPTALSLWAFGDNLHGLNTGPALVGVVSLAGLYLLARHLFGWRVALFALVLAGGNLAHIHYSRIAGYIEPVAFTVWGLYLFLVGLRRGPAWAFVGAGLLAGYGINTYFTGRLLPPLLLVAIALTALAAPGGLRARRRGLALAVAGLLLALGPSLIYSASHLDQFNDRTGDVLITKTGIWKRMADSYELSELDSRGIMLEQFKRTALAVWRYHDIWQHFGMPRPMLDLISGALLMLGLGYALPRLYRPGIALLLAWVAGYVLAGTLTSDPPAYQRLVGLSFPVAILGALALERGLALLPAGRRWAAAGLALGLVLASASGAWNWSDYVAWAADPCSAEDRMEVARFLLTQPQDYRVLIISDDWESNSPDFRFVLPHRVINSTTADDFDEMSALPAPPMIFVLDNHVREEHLERLRRQYPAGRLVYGCPTDEDGPTFTALGVGRG